MDTGKMGTIEMTRKGGTQIEAHNTEANHSRDKWQFLFETLQEIRLCC